MRTTKQNKCTYCGDMVDSAEFCHQGSLTKEFVTVETLVDICIGCLFSAAKFKKMGVSYTPLSLEVQNDTTNG